MTYEFDGLHAITAMAGTLQSVRHQSDPTDIRPVAVRAGGAAEARLSPRTHVRPDGPVGDRGERHLAPEFIVRRPDFQRSDYGRQRECGFQSREVLADTWPATPEERQKLPPIAGLHVLRA